MSIRQHRIDPFAGGYTLIEMVVTVGIFSLAFTAISAIFIGFTTAQSRATVAQRLLNEGNYILEAMTRELRMHAIDYDCEGWDPTTDTNMVCLQAFDGKVIRFYFDPPSGSETTGDLLVCKNYDPDECLMSGSGGSWTSLRPSFMSITNVMFHVYPFRSPYGANVPAEDAWQPMTTVNISIAAGRGRARQSYDLQTAASSRVYGL